MRNSVVIKSNLQPHGKGWIWTSTHTFTLEGRSCKVVDQYRTNKAGNGLYVQYENGRTVQAIHPSRYSLRGMEASLVASEVGITH